MEESTTVETKKECSISKSEINILNNNNGGNKQKISLLEDINNIINNIKKEFDFQSFEKEKLDIIDNVINFI
jgi:hypothetical protein